MNNAQYVIGEIGLLYSKASSIYTKFPQFTVSVSRDFLVLFFNAWNKPIWPPDKQVKMVLLKNLLSRKCCHNNALRYFPCTAHDAFQIRPSCCDVRGFGAPRTKKRTRDGGWLILLWRNAYSFTLTLSDAFQKTCFSRQLPSIQ